MKLYLEVPFKEKDEAKQLGAKWDAVNKKWYAPNVETLPLFEKWKINTDPVVLLGEDRDFGGNNLCIDLIPNSCWFTNVRSCVHPTDWDRLRRYVYERVNHICECCNMDTQHANIPLEAHERWEYNEETQTQKLVRIVALCRHCHQSTHMGLSGLRGIGDEAKEHIKQVRQFTEQEYQTHKEDAFEIWRRRNKINWDLDLSLITSNNIQLLTPAPNKDERQTMSFTKLTPKSI